jgi:protein-S-isoprenylcysteine O-methyltransferase Ste14
MPARDPFQLWLQQTRKTWGLLAQTGVWLVGVLGSFLLPPPVGIASTQDKTWLRFGQFVVAMVIGLVFFGVFKWKQKKHAKWWWLTSLLCLLFAVGAFFRYQQLTYAWTANYEGETLVVGSVYTEQGKKIITENPELTSHLDQLLQEFSGVTANIWTRESIQRRRLLLAATYVSCLPLFTIAVIAVVQAIQCLRSAGTKKKAVKLQPSDRASRRVRGASRSEHREPGPEVSR